MWERTPGPVRCPPFRVSGCPEHAKACTPSNVPFGVHPLGCPADPSTLKRGHQATPPLSDFGFRASDFIRNSGIWISELRPRISEFQSSIHLSQHNVHAPEDDHRISNLLPQTHILKNGQVDEA